MKQETNPFPKTKLQWLWENMKGCRGIYFVGMAGTVVYNILQLTVPYFSGKIVDLFLTGENARENLSTHRDLFYQLILAMVLFTLLRCVIVYGVCMIYEHVSQTVLYRVRNYLYDKIQRQDMTFYSTYRTGDLMTRLTETWMRSAIWWPGSSAWSSSPSPSSRRLPSFSSIPTGK